MTWSALFRSDDGRPRSVVGRWSKAASGKPHALPLDLLPLPLEEASVLADSEVRNSKGERLIGSGARGTKEDVSDLFAVRRRRLLRIKRMLISRVV